MHHYLKFQFAHPFAIAVKGCVTETGPWVPGRGSFDTGPRVDIHNFYFALYQLFTSKNTYFKEYSGIGCSGGFSYRHGGANRPPRPSWQFLFCIVDPTFRTIRE